MIRTFPHGLENNHACKWTFDNFPGMITFVVFLENCQNHLHSWLFSNPCGQVLKSMQSRGQICPILLRRKRTFPHGLENNHKCKWILDNFPGNKYTTQFEIECRCGGHSVTKKFKTILQILLAKPKLWKNSYIYK